jgi:large repetitive protein
LLNAPHRYRVEWKASEVVFYVDGTEVARHSVGIVDSMRPLASDLNAGDGVVSIDWLRMDPYVSSGAFESRVFDSEKSASDWLKLTSVTQKPAGTDATFATRSGSTATPDASWSNWEAVGADGTIVSPDGQYVQYQANLSTTDPSVSPAVEEVTLTYRLDEEIPAAPAKPDLADDSDSGDSKTDDLTNVTTPIFTGTAEAGATVEIFADDSASLGTADTDQGGNWSFTVPDDKALSDGTHSITAKATDKAGNASPASDALSITIDTQEPETNMISGPEGLIGSGAAEFAFSSTEQDTSFQCKLDALAEETCESPKAYSGLGDGQHAFSVRATDLAGNADQSPAQRSFTVDTVKPDAPTITNPQSGSYDTDGTITVSGSAGSGAKVELFEGDTSKGTATADAQGNWSIPLTNVAEGEHTYTAKATDEAGNVSDASAELKVIVDLKVPEVAEITPADGAMNVPVETDVTATFSEDMDQASVEGNFELAEQGSAAVVATVSYDPSTKKATLTPDVDLKASTSYTATLTTDVRDKAGNPLASAKCWSFTTSEPADTTAPTVTIDSKPAAITNNANPSFSYSADEPNSTFECSLSSGTNPDAFTPCSSPKNYGPLANGTYTFKVKAADAAGNGGEAASYSFTVDTTKPAAPPRPDLVAASDTGTSSTDNITKETVPRCSGQAEAGSKVSVYEGGQLLALVNASSAGTWNFQVTTPLSQGVHSITARATDAAGNVSAASVVLSVTIDLTEPTITNIAPGPDSSTRNRTPTIAATVQDERANLSKGNITLNLDGAKVGNFTYDGKSDRLTYKPKNNLSFGAHRVEVQAVDPAGNMTSRSWTFTVIR